MITLKIRNQIQEHLLATNDYFYSGRYGLETFDPDEICLFLEDESSFGLALKRAKKKGILYGVCHALARRILNLLPVEDRVESISKKLSYFDIWSILSKFLGKNMSADNLTDVLDIGMGDSIYLLTFNNVSRKVVLKGNGQWTQSIFGDFLHQLDLPHVTSCYYESRGRRWELSECAEIKNLSDTLTDENLETYISDLGIHAAIGDVLGRGDRHLENYGVKENRVVPFDVSFLFCKDNNNWCKKYLFGGMYEFSTLWYVSNSTCFQDYVDKFFNAYETGLSCLKDNVKAIETLVDRVLENESSEDGQLINLDSKEAVLERVMNKLESNTFLIDQRDLYTISFQEMKRRQVYKEILKQLFKLKPDDIKSNHLLYMYYLSDKDRLSSFFLSEDRELNLFDDIEILAKSILNLEKSEILSRINS
ncbi:hypothetical protein HOG98_00230 [bacterium]|jgi:hypothetical protein|nr:hypothetical protein [bacterium]